MFFFLKDRPYDECEKRFRAFIVSNGTDLLLIYYN